MLQQLHDAPDAEPVQEQKETPKLMVAATTGMVAVSLLLTIFAGPLYAYSVRAGEYLADSGRFVERVLDEPSPLGGGSGVTQIPGFDPQGESEEGTS